MSLDAAISMPYLVPKILDFASKNSATYILRRGASPDRAAGSHDFNVAIKLMATMST
jgi:hypothetical protein